MSITLTASEQIKQLEGQIVELKQKALVELKEQLAEAQKTVADLEAQLVQLTGKADSAASANSVAAHRRTRRPSISDEALKPLILKVMAQHGMNGLNAKEIASFLEQDPLRVRKFIASNPTALKRQGAGPGTRFFLH